MDRVFLDANVLFSAAYRSGSGLQQLWKRADTELITSRYAHAEAVRNLESPEQQVRLASLLAGVRVVSDPDADQALPAGVRLPSKDVPILLAAIEARATHLLTGDKTHFGSLFGQRVSGVLIQPPAAFLAARSGQ